MSMELHVLSDRQLSSVAEWQRAIDQEHYPLQLAADVDLHSVDGFLPSILEGRRTGFECFHDDASETMDFLGKGHFAHPWRFALGFRWRGDFDEMQASWAAATAYAAATAGAIFDHETAKIATPQQARKTVDQIVTARPRLDTAMAEIIGRLGGESA